jgi:serine phosphatase RsbU (regulator of sigma subunit)
MIKNLAIHRRLSVQLGVAVAVLIAVAFAGAGGFVIARERETLTREFTLRLRAETRSLAAAASGSLLRLDPELELHPLLQRALVEMPDLTEIVVLDAHGRIQGHRDLSLVGSVYEPRSAAEANHLQQSELGSESVRLEPDVIVLELPVRHLDQRIGTLIARASRDGIERAVREAQRRLMIFGALATVLAVVAVVGLVRMGLRPLGELRQGVQRLGAGDLATRVRVRARNELGLFGDLVNRMAEGLQTAQAELIHKERLDREIEIAHDLQSMLLPRTAVHATGYEIEARYVPALEVSGDYYDVIPLDAERICLVTADVSGKGVPGLVVMSMLRTLLHLHAEPTMCLAKTLVAANGMLRGTTARHMFVTCHAGILDLTTGEYRYANAGHCPPLRFGTKGVEVLQGGGKPLGMFPDAILEKSLVQKTVHFGPGDGLLLYTDGLVEAFDADGKPLGGEPVQQRLRQHADSDAKRILEDLVHQVDTHRGPRSLSDDLTLIVLRRMPSPIAAEVTR